MASFLSKAFHTLLEPSQEGVPEGDVIEDPNTQSSHQGPTLSHWKYVNGICHFPLQQMKSTLPSLDSPNYYEHSDQCHVLRSQSCPNG